MIKIWGIKNCGTVKKALEFLDLNHISYEFIDYKKTPPEKKVIAQWVEKAGINQVLNSRGTTYKKLQLKDKDLSLEEKIEYMHAYPTLIKRPVLECENHQLLFGFSREEYEKLS
ncbi:arsenate reductase family protein [Helicobacter kayseriensis]|uniref:arsenate reductase family protein n=1 Tax=Helicobacter kayseriensis TaxID=2905877 RepID=UPI001E61B52B|nr:Spx/MgsR family RNA polymerase-binding regulatory protein [Helicobacter kayseriensis]MCE3046846.1 Spx/MgsR family RNA polymerase-binding regulatory protein [Helicobacter kayseriensis]MCE3047852.1 Spx/MgsR family RNA polymerase-binding regulatory protein [Helicobacter kayseriensis]